MKSNRYFWIIIILLLTALITGNFNTRKQTAKPPLPPYLIKPASGVPVITKQITPSPKPTPSSNWKVYSDAIQGIEFRYPDNYFIHDINDFKFSILLNESSNYRIPEGTDAPLIGISIRLYGCTQPEVKQDYPCEKTPVDAIRGLGLRKYFVENTVKTKDITISGRAGKQISGIVTGETSSAGYFNKLTYFSNNSTMDGEYLIVVSLLDDNQTREKLYDEILSSIKFIK